MKIAVLNDKGGVGKTTFVVQISLFFDATIMELDPYGVLSKTLDDNRVYKISLNDKIPSIKDGDVVYDFGGFADNRINSIAKDLDLIIIPFNPTINSLGTTLETYNRLKKLDVPILFIVNAVIKEQDATDALDYLKEYIEDDIDYFIVPHTRALQTSENEALSVIELGNSSGLKRHTYKKISHTMQTLMKKIEEYL